MQGDEQLVCVQMHHEQVLLAQPPSGRPRGGHPVGVIRRSTGFTRSVAHERGGGVVRVIRLGEPPHQKKTCSGPW